MASAADALIRSYGRRRGRRLRPGQEALLRDLLPRLAIPPAESRIEPRQLFGPEIRKVWLEIGFGAGEHLAHQAEHHPEIGFIGCEPYVNGIVALLAKIKAADKSNIRLWPGDGRVLLPLLPDRSIGRASVLFPDPWPKARHHKRRLISPSFLDTLARVLEPEAELRLASDDPDYVAWMLERLTMHPAFRWQARRPSDWRERPPDWPPTRYEEWARSEGRKPAYLRFVCQVAGAASPVRS